MRRTKLCTATAVSTIFHIPVGGSTAAAGSISENLRRSVLTSYDRRVAVARFQPVAERAKHRGADFRS